MPRVSSDYNFAALQPELAGHRRLSRNGSPPTRDAPPLSHKLIWWLCKKGHKWKVSVSNNAHFGANCPFCSGQKLFENGDRVERVASHVATPFHPSKHKTVTSNDVTSGSNTR
jgi:hypothetical protein